MKMPKTMRMIAVVGLSVALMASGSAVAAIAPFRDGERVAFLDVRLWTGGAAYRWTVPGEGERRVAGENDSFVAADPSHPGFTLVEWERDAALVNGYPEVFYYKRAEGVTGVLFPEATHGWKHVGEVVSPWRGVLCKEEGRR